MQKLIIVGIWKEGYCDDGAKREVGEIDLLHTTKYPSNLSECMDLFVVDEQGRQIGKL